MFRAGAGAPCNAIGVDLRDLGEEVTHPFPPSAWHAELERALGACVRPPLRVVVDLSGFDHVVAEDVGFLLRVARQVSGTGGRLTVLAQPRQARRLALVLADTLPCRTTLEEALRA